MRKKITPNIFTMKGGFVIFSLNLMTLHIKDDIKIITDQLEKGNLIGDEIPNIQVSVDNHTYKVRTVNTDSNEGKSNGYRIIYYVIKDDLDIYLVTIYSKKDDKRIPTNSEIIKLIANYCIN